MKVVTLKPDQFDNYAKNHRYRNYMQSSKYANIMTKYGYGSQYIGIVNEQNKLIGATMIIFKKIYMNYKFAYAPRGILYNYENIDNLDEMIEKIKKILNKKKFMLLRIDPYVPLTIRDQEGNIMNFNNKGNEIIDNLKSVGFEYKGKNLFFENEKPRWEALVLLNRDIREIFARFDKQTRNKIRKASNNGIEVIIDQTRNVNKLYEFVTKKEHKPLNYYKEFCNQFADSIDIFYAKLNTETFLINSRRTYEKELEYNNDLQEKIQNMQLDTSERETYINKKMESDKLITNYKNSMVLSTDLLKENPEGIIIAAAMVLKYDNAAYILSEGIDERYDYINANYLVKWNIIDEYNKKGYKYVNLGGVVGEFEAENEYSELNEMKLGFNATVTEYIGEFDMIINNVAYNLYNKFNKR